LCSRARLLDVTHAIEPGDLLGAALVLEEAARWFPPRTAFVVVVDPGVGTDRRALAVAAGGRFFTGPDNGVLRPVIDADPRARVHEIRSRSFRLPEVSATFHGRDVFTPAAVRLATGRPIRSAGPAVTDPVRLEGFSCTRRGGRLEGQVLRVDRFGNLLTSVREADLEAAFDRVPFPTLDIRVGGRRIDETAATYGLARPGVPFALLGSGGRVEISVRDGSAAAALGVARGAEVTVERRGGRR
ncbi:MAG: SAM-dependent chlorinase/fluorinase, partial [Planctomycetes bacterium]|nr:SAM-dependent chlorinase/fluorinase [Planctomycetota bacterium]